MINWTNTLKCISTTFQTFVCILNNWVAYENIYRVHIYSSTYLNCKLIATNVLTNVLLALHHRAHVHVDLVQARIRVAQHHARQLLGVRPLQVLRHGRTVRQPLAAARLELPHDHRVTHLALVLSVCVSLPNLVQWPTIITGITHTHKHTHSISVHTSCRL